MDSADILAQIKSLETADIDPDDVADIFAQAISLMSGYITEADLRRLILIGAATYRNSTKSSGRELQIPSSPEDTSEQSPLNSGFLH